MKVHKMGQRRIKKYAGFGQYELIPTPLCVGAKGLYEGKSYLVTRNWKNVTCKHCLKKENCNKRY